MTGHIPKHFINELLARVDIVSVIKSRIPLKKTGTNYSACCPFTMKKRPLSASVLANSFIIALAAVKPAMPFSFLMDFEHLTFVETISQMAERTGLNHSMGRG